MNWKLVSTLLCDHLKSCKLIYGYKNIPSCLLALQPKYIENLLKSAELRKKEQEKRKERKIQKEREKEGEMYGDKEAFVTSAYKKKMQELAEEEEREKREAEEEGKNSWFSL